MAAEVKFRRWAADEHGPHDEGEPGLSQTPDHRGWWYRFSFFCHCFRQINHQLNYEAWEPLIHRLAIFQRIRNISAIEVKSLKFSARNLWRYASGSTVQRPQISERLSTSSRNRSCLSSQVNQRSFEVRWARKQRSATSKWIDDIAYKCQSKTPRIRTRPRTPFGKTDSQQHSQIPQQQVMMRTIISTASVLGLFISILSVDRSRQWHLNFASLFATSIRNQS